MANIKERLVEHFILRGDFLDLQIKKLSELATLPTRGTEESAGLDLYAAIEGDVTIKSKSTATIPIGIAISLPTNTAGLIYIRSGMAFKYGLCLVNSVGVIDSDYRGEIVVGIYNSSDTDYTVQCGERVAQLVVTPYIKTNPIFSDIDETKRGEGGFGSTGK